MKPVIALFDDFFADPDLVLSQIRHGEFKDFISPWDGVVYSMINTEPTFSLKKFIERRLSEIMQQPVEIKACFARAMTEGMRAPHRIHSDKIMADFSMHIYVSDEWPENSGTAFWSHETEGHRHTDETNISVIQRDQRDMSRWNRTMLVVGKKNRAVIHDACLFHSAEPSEGWGTSAVDGRVVITTFFSFAKRGS